MNNVISPEDLGPIFSIENWPTSNTTASQALSELETTHRVIPIPAYDMHGALIWPSQYPKFLQNAVAEFRFTLTHWSIGGKDGGVDAYTADIVDILVLIPPPPTVVSPRKRKVAAHHPSSPTKRSRP
jgi:hypothetical protein